MYNNQSEELTNNGEETLDVFFYYTGKEEFKERAQSMTNGSFRVDQQDEDVLYQSANVGSKQGQVFLKEFSQSRQSIMPH